jgi:hypothetical protein
MVRTRLLISFALFLCTGWMAHAAKTDLVLILVEGMPASTEFGFSGLGSMYFATGQTSVGKATFTEIVKNVALERNSTNDPQNQSNFGEGGFVPPGVYFLHYHRLDLKISSQLPRHRLTFSDQIEGETVTVANAAKPRDGLQFHTAFNDLKEFKVHVSEGCITLTAQNFFRLFPSAFLDPASSPLKSHQNSGLALTGDGKVLVFIADVNEPTRKAQLAIFSRVLKGDPQDGIGPITNAAVGALRTTWRTAN